MRKTITLDGDIVGEIRAQVTLEFLSMSQITPDEDRTPASKHLQIADVNNRLAAVADALERSLEKMTLEELESRIRS